MTTFVAICDDNPSIIGQIDGFLIEVFRGLGIKFEIDDFSSAEELCNGIETGKHYDIIFLDIMLSEMNGIEAGKMIRNKYKNDAVSIVYISFDENYSMQLFDIRPLNFLIKPLSLDKVKSVIETHLRVVKYWTDTFAFKIKHNTHKVKIKDIMYFESFGKEIVLYKSDGSAHRFYGSLKSIYDKQLQNYNFMYAHSSYLVNYIYVEVFKHNELTLTNSTIVPISQRKRKDIKEMQIKILGDNFC